MATAVGLYSLSRQVKADKAKQFAKRKVFRVKDYETILAPYMGRCRSVTCREAAAGGGQPDDEILVIRHDIDHDIETAHKIARWEHRHDLKASYCVLHTAWYYGQLQDGHMQHTQDLLDLCHELLELGHEVMLHNNLVVTALVDGVDPVAFLREELEFFRGMGVPIYGTSSHGDRLCRQLEFRNYEFFKETVWESRGGVRTITHEGRSLLLGQVSMHDFDLEYEAYDFPRDTYISESGGHLRTREETKGRGGKTRRHLTSVRPGKITGVLTHPIWWDFDN